MRGSLKLRDAIPLYPQLWAPLFHWATRGVARVDLQGCDHSATSLFYWPSAGCVAVTGQVPADRCTDLLGLGTPTG